ncbi:MAG: CHAT domain-containing protein [Actinobacteria bacterium]|nr:CHAT domain-containing protein [Actinomycetota bacterium]
MVADRLELCRLDADLAERSGDGKRAQRLLERGARVIDRYRERLTALDLRVGASALGAGIARSGLRLAVQDGDAEGVLRWADRTRAGALRVAESGPIDSGLVGELGRLRALEQRLAQVSARPMEIARLAREAREIEETIRRRSRARGRAGARRPGGDVSRLRALPAGKTLLQLVETDDGRLLAIRARDGRVSLHELGDRARREASSSQLGLALARVGGARDVESRLRATRRVEAIASELVAGCPVDGAGGRAALLVLVPSSAFLSVPWAIVPELVGAALSVAPSAATWLELDGRARAAATKPSVVVVGPRLRGASSEVSVIASVTGGRPLAGADARVDRVLAAMDGARIAHFACHGHFRADAPLFSSLELYDGPLNVYDLQQLKRPPGMVVLSACDLGLSEARPGDELLGMATALLAMGTRTVIASVIPIPDRIARKVMVAFHTHLVGGKRPAEALALAQAALPPRDRIFAGFVCIGAG